MKQTDSNPADNAPSQAPISGLGQPVSPQTSDELTPPQIDGYTIQEPLGRGGMGVVWRAVQHGTRQVVALKVMAESVLWSLDARKRFEREIELAAKLNHPNIARVYEAGLHRRLYYYAMELVDGLPIDQYVREKKLTTPQIVELMASVASALVHAHQNAIIHRDLKPSNILITADGQPKVLDFGMAKALLTTDPGQKVSQEGQCAGTLAYMAPEQAAGDVEKVDTRADVYALGVILYELITSTTPHDLRGTFYEVQKRIVEDDTRRPRSVKPGLDPELESLLVRALAKAPADRYQSAGDFRRDLGSYLTGDPLLAGPATMAYFLCRRLRKHRVPITAAALVTLGVMILIIVGYLRERALRIRTEHARMIAVQETERAHRESEARRRALYLNTISLADSAYQRSQIKESQDLLDRCPNDLRHWEWYYLQHLTDAADLTFPGQGRAVFSAVWDQANDRVLVADSRSVATWDPTTGDRTGLLTLEGPYAETALFCSTGSRLVTVSDWVLNVWDTASGTVVESTPAQARTLALSSDGSHVAWAGYDHRINLWVPQSQRPATTLDVPGGASVKCLTLSADGGLLATATAHRAITPNPASPAAPTWGPSTGDAVAVWDTTAARELQQFNAGVSVSSLAFSPDGRRLAAGARQSLTLWDLRTGRLVFQTNQPARCLAFSPDGRYLAAGGWDGVITVVDTDTGSLQGQYFGHQQMITCLNFSPDGHWLISGSADTSVKLWNLLGPSRHLLSLPGPVLGLDPWNVTVAHQAGLDGSAGLAATFLDSGRPLAQLPIDPAQVESIAIHPFTGTTAVASFQGRLELWDNQRRQPIASHPGAFRAPVFSADGEFLAALTDGQTVAWETHTGKEVFRQSFTSATTPTAPEMTNDPSKGSPGKSSGGGSGGFATCVAINTDGSLLAAGCDRAVVKLWSLPSGREIGTLESASSGTSWLAFTRDGRRLVAVTIDNAVVIWDPTSKSPVGRARLDASIEAKALSPNGHWLAVGGFGQITLIDLTTGRDRFHLQGHRGVVASLAFSNDGARLASVEEDGTLKLWDVPTGTQIMTLHGQVGLVAAAVFADHDRQILLLGQDGSIARWQAPGYKSTETPNTKYLSSPIDTPTHVQPSPTPTLE